MKVPLFLFFVLVQTFSLLVVSPSFFIARFRKLVTRGLRCLRFVRTLHVFPTWLLVFFRVRFQAVPFYPFEDIVLLRVCFKFELVFRFCLYIGMIGILIRIFEFRLASSL